MAQIFGLFCDCDVISCSLMNNVLYFCFINKVQQIFSSKHDVTCSEDMSPIQLLLQNPIHKIHETKNQFFVVFSYIEEHKFTSRMANGEWCISWKLFRCIVYYFTRSKMGEINFFSTSCRLSRNIRCQLFWLQQNKLCTWACARNFVFHWLFY